jgi:hypothetical protein
MEERMGCFVRGAPEVYFNKPFLSQQRVAPRRRPFDLKKQKRNKITTTRRQGVMARFWRRWFSWFPFPLADKV